MERSSTTKAESFAPIGTKQEDAATAPRVTSTSARDVATSLMEPRSAISQRRQKPLTPLVADEWEAQLQSSQLLQRYPQIPMFIRHGAHAGIPHILHSFTPPNNPSTESLSDIFYDIIQSEFNKGRYLGPFSKEELENEIGPFQSSPLSLVPKPGKPGKYRLIQNLSYPHNNQPTPSINSSLNSDDFPCTWGTFRTVATLIRNLPQGSQAATRDIAEAYRIIPLHENQWPGVVVRISNSPSQFALNTSNCFGGATAGGLFGLFADALADILRANGIGPILKWVDDFVFFRIPKHALKTYNFERQITRKIIADNGGMQQSGGRLWFKGKTLDDTGAEHFAEDMNFSIQMIKEYRESSNMYTYGFEEINKITAPLGIPWEVSKDVPFSSTVVFAGLSWDIENKTVSLPDSKKEKYIRAINEWFQQPVHTLDETRKLYGKLLYACHIIPAGRAYLTSLEKMMATFNARPFTPRNPPKLLRDDLAWWRRTLSQPSLLRDIPGGRQIHNIQAYSDASSSVGIGIVIGERWRAWRLLPGWKAKQRDIGWAEAVGMELLVKTILQFSPLSGFQVYGDNNGVVEGWWTGRSRNEETNQVFRRIHKLLERHKAILSTRYVNTAQNPADHPSRGIYPPRHLLLPPIKLPIEIRDSIIDFDAPLQPGEGAHPQNLPPVPKTPISRAERLRRNQANSHADDAPDETAQTSSSG